MNVAQAMTVAKAHFAAGRHAEAEAIFRRVLAADPNNAGAWHGLGVIAGAHGHSDHGIPMLRRAIALAPDRPLYHSNLGELLRRAGLLEEAIECCAAALRLRTNAPYALYNLALAQRDMGRLEDALANGRKAAELTNDDGGVAHSALLVTLHYVPTISRDEMFAEHRAWARRHTATADNESAGFDNNRDPDRKLRIGYVSGDFREHSVAYFIRPVLAHHDPANIELYCYSNSLSADAQTNAFRKIAMNWRDVAAISDARLVETIRRDAIDVLVDLSGHTGGGRLRAFATRAAPVQATYLGYPDTTGLPQVQWRITDAIADPPAESDHYHTERLMRLPRTFLTYAPPADAPDVGDTPAAAERPVTFVSFNAIPKINSGVVRAWARILQGAAGSRLILKAFAPQADASRDRLAGVFAAHGVGRERLELLPRAPSVVDHLAHYRRADLALDAFPYNGVTTTCEAMWMGVPVITLAGDRHASRVGASLLAAVNLTQLIATDEDAYVRIAVALARDRDRLAELRAGMRERVARSPLMDAAAFVADLERAYRAMWREWCATPT